MGLRDFLSRHSKGFALYFSALGLGAYGIYHFYRGISDDNVYRDVLGLISLGFCSRTLISIRSARRMNALEKEPDIVERNLSVEMSYLEVLRDNQPFLEDLEDRAS